MQSNPTTTILPDMASAPDAMPGSSGKSVWAELRRLLVAHPQWFLPLAPLLLLLIGPARWDGRLWLNPEGAQSYQLFAPLGAALIAWLERRFIADYYAAFGKKAGDDDRRGLYLLGAWIALYLIAYPLRLPTVSVALFVGIVAGTTRALYGRRMLVPLKRPLMFLCLMIPLPYSLESTVTQQMQLQCASNAGDIFNALGLHAIVEGNHVSLDSYSFWVAPACSGLTTLMPLLAITIWLFLALQSNLFQKTFMLCMVFFVALALNVLRIVAIGLVGHADADLGALLHDANSWLFTIFSFVIILRVARYAGIRELCLPHYASQLY